MIKITIVVIVIPTLLNPTLLIYYSPPLNDNPNHFNLSLLQSVRWTLTLTITTTATTTTATTTTTS